LQGEQYIEVVYKKGDLCIILYTQYKYKSSLSQLLYSPFPCLPVSLKEKKGKQKGSVCKTMGSSRYISER